MERLIERVEVGELDMGAAKEESKEVNDTDEDEVIVKPREVEVDILLVSKPPGICTTTVPKPKFDSVLLLVCTDASGSKVIIVTAVPV